MTQTTTDKCKHGRMSNCVCQECDAENSPKTINMPQPQTTPFLWNKINMHELLSRFHIHSTTEEDDLLYHASLQNDRNLHTLSVILQQAYTVGYCRGLEEGGSK